MDLVRCESLQALDPATRMRVLQRNYAVLVSMSPMGRDVHALSRSVVTEVGMSWNFRLDFFFTLAALTLRMLAPPLPSSPAHGSSCTFTSWYVLLLYL